MWRAVVGGAVLALGTIGSASALDATKWRADIRYLGSELPRRHAKLFHTLSRAEFERDLAALEQQLPSLSDLQVRLALHRIVAKVGDLHTSVVLTTEGLHRFPLDFHPFSDGIYVVASAPGFERAAGSRLVAIDDTPIAQVETALARLVGCENAPCRRNHLPNQLVFAEFLHEQQLIRSPERATFTFEGADLERFSLELPAEPDAAATAARTFVDRAAAAPEHQLWLQQQGKPYWFTYLPTSRLLYFAYNRCVDDANDPFETVQRRFLELADNQPIDRVVIDLRRNGGGSERVLRPLIRQIARRPKLNRQGVLFVVMGGGTYSSAASHAVTFKEWTAATLVGEPTGQKPNAYGEKRELLLPNSRLPVAYATTFWRRVAGDPTSIEPDLAAPQSFAAFKAGIDTAMQAILALPRQPPQGR